MILGTAISKHGVTIRLTDERWLHITYSHKEIGLTAFPLVLETIEAPDVILEGDSNELLAAKKRNGGKDWIVVVYKETDANDGFVLTAYVTTDFRWLLKRKIVWNKPS